jgi:hypothetical protein
MTDPKRDPNGRFRNPRPYETVIDHLRAKHAAAAQQIGLVQHTPSPSSPDAERTADVLRDQRRSTVR